MKPLYSFLFILGIFILLTGVSVLFPEKGIPLSQGDTLFFPSVKSVFEKEEIYYPDITKIIEQSNVYHDSISDNPDSLIITEFIPADSISKDTTPIEIKVADVTKLRANIHKIQFPNNDASILYPIYAQMLQARNNKKLIRILHYGDSQIEGDRITSYLRNKFQLQFGGGGIGLLPAKQPFNYQTSIRHTSSDNWATHTVFPAKDKDVNHDRYGILGSFCRFTPCLPDSLLDSATIVTSFVTYEPSPVAYNTAKKFSNCQLFYGFNKKPLGYQIFVDNELFDADILESSDAVKKLNWNFTKYPNDITIKFSGEDSPEVYGFALDNGPGVAVDNIAMRGSAGFIFTRMDRSVYKQIFNQLNVEMVILQFGGNVVPWITNFGYYERVFQAQLMALKKINPNLPIIVIGPADMASNQNGHMQTHPNVEGVRDAIKKATFNAGCAYWDMYEAMGGKNSIVSWVESNPPLASSDYIHFSPKGAKVIAEMFYNAFMYEFNMYQKNTKSGE